MSNVFTPFHLVRLSIWPLITRRAVFRFLTRAVFWFSFHQPNFILINLALLSLVAYCWWRDVNREAVIEGNHTITVTVGLKYGIGLFIFSEVLLFARFFWTFLHRRLAPVAEIGVIWPPVGVTPLNAFQVPLLNTMILLRSGVTVTWRHYKIMCNKTFIPRLARTIGLGVYFTFLQAIEYKLALFRFADSVYGRIFFIRTGFHGGHVIIGSIFLIVILIRRAKKWFTRYHHVAFELAIWYWHFVDVVWLFLFSLIYWWGFLSQL